MGLVLLHDIMDVGMAYQASEPILCRLCQSLIHRGEYYTRHYAPDFVRFDPVTRKTPVVHYNACKECVTFDPLEKWTGEFSFSDVIKKLANQMIHNKLALEDTRTDIPAVTKQFKGRGRISGFLSNVN